MNKIEKEIVQTPFNEEVECAKFVVDDTSLPFVFHNVIKEVNKAHVFSFWAKSEVASSVTLLGKKYDLLPTWTRHNVYFVSALKDLSMFFNSVGVYYFFESQLEEGSVPTDYRPAVEDVEEEAEETRTIALQTRNMFKWIVESDESETEFTLTERMATLIADTISLNGNVKVNGDMLVNGTITADKINLKDLFAQNIEAEGTIKGLRLEGASGDFSGQVKADSLYVNGNLIYTNGGDYDISHVDYDPGSGMVIDVFSGFSAAHDSSIVGNRDNPQGILRIDSVLAVEITGNLFGIQTLACSEVLSDYVKAINVYAKIVRSNNIYEGNQLLSDKYVLSEDDVPVRQNIASVTPSAVGSSNYNFLSIPNMSIYKTISFNAWIGDVCVNRCVIYPNIDNGSIFKINGYHSPSYNAVMDILIDTTNSRIGVRLKSLTGWTASNCGIGTIITTK